ncbi:MAG: hypothetical protein QOD12_2249 [Verrucomicrobiota bacterium]
MQRSLKDRSKTGAHVYLPPPRPVIGLEAEFSLFIDDVQRRPEAVFGTPQKLVRRRMIPRTGRSFQLPAGGAIYFDTGVIEVATPIVELEPGCCYRATRLLWEQIQYLRSELDAWSERNRCRARLQGFSTHYNLSFRSPGNSRRRTVTRLSHLLAHVLPAPLLLLAANRKSTAIGVRPREERIEVTADFTPDAALMLASCAFIVGAVEAMRLWPSYELTELDAHRIPRLTPFELKKHSSRRGWRVLAGSLARNPFACDVNEPDWKLRDGRTLSWRAIAAETLKPFRGKIRQLSDPATLEHIDAVLDGDARSLLDFPDRPKSYEDAGRELDWNRRRLRRWPPSAYEKVIHRVIAHESIQIKGKRYRAERMRGWYEVIFRESKTGARHIFNLDYLAKLMAKKKARR